MLRSRTFQSTILAVAALLVTRVALADTAAPGACKADVKKLCSKVKPAHGAVLVCLEQNTDKVSQKCQAALTDTAQAVENACKPELDKFCATVEHGQGRLLQCLAQHEADFGADCKAFWGKAKSATKKAAAK